MALPFEAPRKTDLRERAALALDAAGYRVEGALSSIPLPEELNLKGAIVGDLQAVDEDGTRSVFCVRNDWNKAVPQWIANWARASHHLEKVRIYVLVDEVSSVMEKSCRSCGAGLLLLTRGDQFSLQTIVDPTTLTPEQLAAEFSNRLKEARRRMERKLDLNRRDIERKFGEVKGLVEELSNEKQAEYMAALEGTDKKWQDWGARLSERLDEASSSGGLEELHVIETEIDQGIDLQGQ